MTQYTEYHYLHYWYGPFYLEYISPEEAISIDIKDDGIFNSSSHMLYKIPDLASDLIPFADLRKLYKINVLNTGIISAQTGLKFCKTIRLSSQFLKAFQWENSHLIDRWRKEIIFHFLPGASRDKTRMNNIFIT